MNKRKKESIVAGILILALLLGDIYARDALKWVWMIGVFGLFGVFSIFIYGKK